MSSVPPAKRARPSGRRDATWPYADGPIAPALAQACAAGLQRSAEEKNPNPFQPPAVRTLPSARRIAGAKLLAAWRLPVALHVACAPPAAKATGTKPEAGPRNTRTALAMTAETAPRLILSRLICSSDADPPPQS